MSKLLIKRFIASKHLVISTDCPSGKVSMLVDETGDSLNPYLQVLSGKTTMERFILTLDDQPFAPTQHTLIGFGEKLPEKIGIKEYLVQSGGRANEIDSLMEKYDLTQHSYLSCAQLPLTQARQIQLLATHWSSAKVVIVNDPFQPFSGRWREAFAEQVAKDTVEKGRITIVMNLSFMPQVWDKNPNVANLQIGNAGRQIEKTAEQKSLELDKLAKAAEDEKTLGYDDKRVTIKVPTDIVKAWKVPQDYIFEPLAKLSQRFRSLSGALALAALSFLVVLMGVVMFPQLSMYRDKLVQIATKFDPDLGKKLAAAIIPQNTQAMQNDATNPAEPNEDQVTDAEEGPADTENQVAESTDENLGVDEDNTLTAALNFDPDDTSIDAVPEDRESDFVMSLETTPSETEPDLLALLSDFTYLCNEE